MAGIRASQRGKSKREGEEGGVGDRGERERRGQRKGRVLVSPGWENPCHHLEPFSHYENEVLSAITF